MQIIWRMDFDHEMTPEQQKRAEAYRRTLLSGGVEKVKGLARAMGMR